jgi:hypothetical protein
MPAFGTGEVGDADAARLHAYIIDTINKGGWR